MGGGGKGGAGGGGKETCHSASLPTAVTGIGTGAFVALSGAFTPPFMALIGAFIALICTLTGELSSACRGGSEPGFRLSALGFGGLHGLAAVALRLGLGFRV